MKRKIALLALLAVFAAIAASGTIAYFTAETRAHNVITSGGVGITLIEKMDDGNPETELETFVNQTGVMPGQDVSKIVTVQNDEEKSWIRVQVNIVGQFADDTAMMPDQLGVFEIDFDEKETYWIYDEDSNYWYYRNPVETAGVTEALFTKIHFDELMGNEYQNCKLEVLVNAEATQYANNNEGLTAIETLEDIAKINGWPN